jgi:ABC-type branched-subunit amino acid transport system substrate-binding protein
MRPTNPWRRTAAVLGAIAILAAACGSDDSTAPAPAPAPTPAPAPVDTAPVFDVGVTEEPCAQPAAGVSNPGNGCIYLGILSDLTVGPFASLGVVIQLGQQDFWGRVNASGGIGGFDIDIDTYTRDTKYNPSDHSQAYRQIEPNILLLAQSLGTPTTEFILDDMDADDVLAGPAGWWSGFNFKENTKGLILPSGYSYCIESMIGLDFFSENVRPITGVAAVGFPGDFGGDVAEGARLWAEANDVPFLGFFPTGQTEVQVPNQNAAIGSILQSGADVVVLGVGPRETAEIVGGVAVGTAATPGAVLFLGAGPTWNPLLLQTAAAPALVGLYTNVSPWEDYTGTSAGHAAMREAFGANAPVNQGYSAGWTWQYPIKALLEAGVASGDLTRANLRALADGLEVDYEGVLPSTRMGGDPNVNVNRTAVIGRVDPTSPNGLQTIVDGYRGKTADAFAYTAACSG